MELKRFEWRFLKEPKIELPQDLLITTLVHINEGM
jgi:hypothetical protein